MADESENWNAIVQKLLEKYTQVELSDLTDVNQSTISELSRGVEKPFLSYKNGKSLLEVYRNLENEKGS